ncbi:MAG: trypsin-like peptidase domain-containing protein [Deltaproteobacteria bacterium]|nr:trypsin-like peptidase domain-containing protein [Deltaproteobacteria bacterium]
MNRFLRGRFTTGAWMATLICALSFLFLTGAAARKVYRWIDKEGKIHFSDKAPDPSEVGGGIDEREVQDLPPPEVKELPARTPVEHAINCTFRLANKRGGGSGFFINDKGLAVTARHVVEGIYYSMKAELPNDDKKLVVRILERSRKYDIALLQVMIDPPTPFLEIRDHETLIRGEQVFAIGNPLLDYRETVTNGIYSRTVSEEDFKDMRYFKIKPPFKGDFIQCSTPVFGGNSGGPVIDQDGKAIGIVSWGIRAPSYGALNFAVPCSYILKEYSDYLEK